MLAELKVGRVAVSPLLLPSGLSCWTLVMGLTEPGRPAKGDGLPGAICTPLMPISRQALEAHVVGTDWVILTELDCPIRSLSDLEAYCPPSGRHMGL